MLNAGFAPWPSFTEQEIDAVQRVLRSNRVNYWTGSECRAFEHEFADWIGVDYAVALANGTLALEAALRALGIGTGDEVIVPARTFFATASSVVSVGAIPVFADIDRDSQNITAKSIEAVCTPATRAVICVHLAGWPCEMDDIRSLADEKGFYVIEDCAQSHGAAYRGRMVGSLGDVAAWSFCQDKIMTTGGEGGMLTTSSPDIWTRAWSIKDHGKSWSAVNNECHSPGFRWLHETFGSNWRLTEIQAAIGRIQLSYMPRWHETRLRYAKYIWTEASMIEGIRVPLVPGHLRHAAYKCYVFIEPERLRRSWSRDRVVSEMVSLGIPCYSGSCPEVYREKAFEGTGWRPPVPLPVARELGETSLMFLVHPTLSENDIERTMGALRSVMSRGVR